MDIAEKHNLFVVEDACHAPGVNFNGKSLGTIGDIGCFSFFSNKNLTTGEGGMIVTNNDKLAEKMKLIRSHGMTTLTWDRHKGHSYSYDVIELGYNYRLDEIRAALGIEQLKKLERNNQLRKNMVENYKELLSGVDEIKIPFMNNSGNSSYHLFPILVESKIDTMEFRNELKTKGIQTSMHYPPIHLFSLYKQKFGYQEGDLPITEEISKREVTLPLYPTMGGESVEYVAGAIKSILLA
jgi:dTDP-4-amino-4,6-dideoxygalactose transaminase